MKALVVGVTGVIGQLLAKELLARGHSVSGLDLASEEAWPEGVRKWSGDLRRTITQEAVRIERPDVVVHLGTVSPLGKRGQSRARVNLRGTQAVVEAVLKFGVRQMLFIGSHAYYGAAPDLPLCHRENEPPYAVETFPELSDFVAAELMANVLLSTQPKVKLTVLRLCHSLGPSGRGALGRLLRGHRVPTVLGFDPLVQFMHEADLARAIRVAIEQELSGCYNVGGEHPLPLSTVIQNTGRVITPIPESLFRLSLGPFGLSEIPAGALSQFKYSILVDDGPFRTRTGFRSQFDETATLSQFASAFPV
jgi:UDP-glucose 4-epimerase